MRAIAGIIALALLGSLPLASALEPVVVSTADPVMQTEFALNGADTSVGAPEECEEWLGEEYGYGAPCSQWWCQSWYVRVEAMVLQRTRGGGDRVIVESDAGAPLLTTGSFSFDLEPGASVLLGHRLDSVSAWEMLYFGAQQWNQTQSIASLNNLDLPDPLGGLADDFNNADIFGVTYQSHLNNAELNYLRDAEGVSWLIGFRYLNWEESLRLSATDNDSDVSAYQLGTSNNLLGVQIGGRAMHRGCRWDWELTGKAGIFGNEVVQNQSLFDNDSTTVLRNVSVKTSGAAFIGDVNLSAHCRLNDMWSLRAGYSLIGITNLALAPNQLDFSNGPSSGRGVDRNGSILLHGLNVGIETLW